MIIKTNDCCNEIVSYKETVTTIEFDDSVTSIGKKCFMDFEKLTSINFDGTKAQWNAINKGSAINYTIHCIDGDISK